MQVRQVQDTSCDEFWGLCAESTSADAGWGLMGSSQQQRNAELAKSDLWNLINHAAMLNGSINYIFPHRCREVGTGVCHLKHPYFAHIKGRVKNYSGCTHSGSVNHRPFRGGVLL